MGVRACHRPRRGWRIALLGAFGGPWIKARTDLDQWRRDKRMDAYAELARTIHDLTEAITWRLAAAQALIESSRQSVEQATFELLRAAGRVQLVGPPSVQNASVELARYVAEVTVPLRSVPVPNVPLVSYAHVEPQEILAINEGLNLRYDTFMKAARRDPGVQ